MNKEFHKKGLIQKQPEGYRVIMSKQIEDRDGEIIMIDGIGYEKFLENPVVLYMHDMHQLVGKVNKMEKGVDSDGIPVLWGWIEFADNDKGKEVEKLVANGFLRAVSIGFANTQWEGNNCVKCDLFEVSTVTIPANSGALFKSNEEGKVNIEKALSHYLDIKPRVKAYRELIMDAKLWETLEIEKTGNEIEDTILFIQTIKNLIELNSKSEAEANEETPQDEAENEETPQEDDDSDVKLLIEAVSKI